MYTCPVEMTPPALSVVQVHGEGQTPPFPSVIHVSMTVTSSSFTTVERRLLHSHNNKCHPLFSPFPCPFEQVRDEGSAALLQLREQLGAAHDADRALLLREMAQLQQRIGALRQLALAGE